MTSWQIKAAQTGFSNLCLGGCSSYRCRRVGPGCWWNPESSASLWRVGVLLGSGGLWLSAGRAEIGSLLVSTAGRCFRPAGARSLSVGLSTVLLPQKSPTEAGRGKERVWESVGGTEGTSFTWGLHKQGWGTDRESLCYLLLWAAKLHYHGLWTRVLLLQLLPSTCAMQMPNMSTGHQTGSASALCLMQVPDRHQPCKRLLWVWCFIDKMNTKKCFIYSCKVKEEYF